MTNEELELSLRSEFENYLKGVAASMRQDVDEFQRNFDAEFSKHRAQMDEAIRLLAAKFEQRTEVDLGLSESLGEHLRLARDGGARLAAEAFSEAEKLRTDTAVEDKYSDLRDSIRDIGGQLTQAAILRSLVEHSHQFAPRGAFFIVKSGTFVCWKAFNEQGAVSEDTFQNVRVAEHSASLLSRASETLATAEGAHGAYADDDQFLEPLGFGRPDRMYAIPLVVRGRAVAVLYVDYGIEGTRINREALESLVSVAALTVELRAAVHPAAHQEIHETPRAEEAAPAYSAPAEPAAYEAPVEYQAPAAEEVAETTTAFAEDAVQTDYDHATEQYQMPTVVEHVEESDPGFAFATPVEVETVEPMAEVEEAESVYEVEETPTFAEFVPETPVSFEPEPVTETPAAFADYAFEPTSQATELPEVETFAPEQSFEASPSVAEEIEQPPFEPVVEAPPAVAEEPVLTPPLGDESRQRLDRKTIDLPIDVPEEERDRHNKARRFARLLVSEIKLYNEQKVLEGRASNDLYDRLREAIDRSREMYEKRVDDTVSSKFDYFHYELITNLAEGDEAKLGENYAVAA